MRNVQGVICRLFPSRYTNYFGDCSPALVQELRRQIKGNNILVHHHSVHTRSLYLIAYFFRNIPIVAQHHDDQHPLSRFKKTRKLTSLLAHFVERISLKYVDYFFVLMPSEKEFLSTFLPSCRIAWQTMGVDFSEFKPVDKVIARQKLGLPQDKKIILHIGRFEKHKGLDGILRVYPELKKRYDIELILIGGSPKNALYEEVKKSGARFYEYIPHAEIGLYDNAADIYLLPAFNPDYRAFDVSAMESLACNTPVISKALNEFPLKERERLGCLPKDESDIIRCVDNILRNSEVFRQCRGVAERYFDWKNIIKNTVDIYDKLFKDYYHACPN
jgi:glycosyltransferase involved in cell wall biosynthesis